MAANVMPANVLVTGATGVVGGATVRALLANGHRVTTLQRRALPDDLAAAGARGIRGDITNADDARRACDGIDVVVHAAARVEVTGPWSDFERVNIDGTATMLHAARDAGANGFVFVSSPSVAHAGEPLVGADADPASPEHARSHYARSKAIAEIAVLAADTDDMATVAIRPHLVWGPGDTQLTARIIDRARSGRLVLIGSGAALIDTTYIDNAGTALAAAVDRVHDEQVHGRAFVVSNGQPRTVAEMLTRIAAAADAPGPRAAIPYPLARLAGHVAAAAWDRLDRPGDPVITPFVAEQLATAHWFDQRATRDALQWSPRVSVDEGFELLAAYEFEGSRVESALFSLGCPCGLAPPVRTAGLARRSPCGGATVLTFASCSSPSTPTAPVRAIRRIALLSPGASPRLGCFLRCHPAISRRAGIVLAAFVKATQPLWRRNFRDFGPVSHHELSHVFPRHICHRSRTGLGSGDGDGSGPGLPTRGGWGAAWMGRAPAGRPADRAAHRSCPDRRTLVYLDPRRRVR